MGELEFLAPLWLLLIPLYVICKRFCNSISEGVLFSRIDIIKKITGKKRRLASVFEALSVVCAVLALSEPAVVSTKTVENITPKKCMFIIDTRSEGFKELGKEFIQGSNCDLQGIVAFGDEIYAVSPISSNRELTIDELLVYEPKAGEKRAFFEAITLARSMLLGDGEVVLVSSFVSEDMKKDIKKANNIYKNEILTSTEGIKPSVAQVDFEEVTPYFGYFALFGLLFLSGYMYLINKIEI